MAEQGPAPAGYTVDEALVAIGYGKFHVKVFLYAMLGSVAEAMELMLLTYIGLATEADFKLTSSEENLISVVTYAGIIFGAWLWSAVSDSFGRKPGFFGSAIVTSVAGFLSCAAPNYVTLLILRGIVGFGLGGAHVFTTWGMEFVPTLNTGILMIGLFACCSIGTSLEALLAWLIVPTYGWRVLFAVSSFPSLLALLFYITVDESPRYLYSKGRLEDALKVLMDGATLNGKELPEGSLIPADITVRAPTTDESSLNEPLITSENPTPETSSSGGDEVLDVGGENNGQQAQPGRLSAMLLLLTWIRNTSIRWITTKFFPWIQSSFLLIKMLFSATWYKTTILLLLLYFMNTYSYSGIIHLTSELNSQDITDPGFYRNVFIISLAEFPGLCLAALTMQTVGRKMAMVNMLVMGFILFLVETIDQCQTIMTSVFATRMVMSGCFVVIQIYAEEVYPTRLRTTAVGIAIMVGRIGSIGWPLAPAGMGDDTHKTPGMIMPGFFGSAIVTSVAGFLSCAAPNYVTLLILRGIVGFGLGGAHVFTTWGMEFVPTLNTGILMIGLFACCSIGTSLEALLAWLIVPTYGWRVLFAVSSFPSLLALLFYITVDESPRYLYSKGRLEDALKVLMDGAKLNGKVLPEGSLIPADITVRAPTTDESSLNEPLITSENPTPETSSSGGDEVLDVGGENNGQQAQPGRLSAMLLLLTWIRTTSIRWITTKFFPWIKSSFLLIKMLFSATWYKTTILLWLLYFMNTYSYSGIIHLTSELNSQDITDPGFYRNVFIISLAEFPGLCLAALTMQTVGRRMAMVNMLVMGFILFLVQIIDQCQTIMTSVFATRMVMSGCFVVIQIYAEEVYPTCLRTTAVGIAIIAGRIGSIVWPLAPAGMGDDTHKTPGMIMFALKIFLSCVFALMLPLETRLGELADNT